MHSKSLTGLLKPYWGSIAVLAVFTIIANGLNLVVPQIIARGIDAYTNGNFILGTIVTQFAIIAAVIFVLTYLQNIVQTYASERVARDLREKVSDKISKQSFAYVQDTTPAKLLTNLTSDIDGVKLFISQAIVAMLSSVLLIIGASTLLFLTDWRLAMAVLMIVPIIGITFYMVLSKVKPLFTKTQEVIDWLNKVINESILGSALIRVLNAEQPEYEKFVEANANARTIGLTILRLFAGMIPIITFVSNLAVLVILALGGKFVIDGTLTLGNFAAFQSYLSILIFPIFVIGFMSGVITRASASYARVIDVLNAPDQPEAGLHAADIRGDIEMKNISVRYGEKMALKNVSFSLPAHTKTAIIGPTGAGKTQLLHLLTGLMPPTEGTLLFDGHDIATYDKTSLHNQIGFVFQDSVLFNLTLLENIAFGSTAKTEDVEKAIETAELKDFIESLPQKLDTIVSERGTSLSGGQKQRIMLARALALNPKILLLDDFTARVDSLTEKKILDNVAKNYPNITLVSVTQKISSIESYDKVLLLMEGELLAQGTHEELLHTSPEYAQIAQSQRSTSHYEQQQ